MEIIHPKESKKVVYQGQFFTGHTYILSDNPQSVLLAITSRDLVNLKNGVTFVPPANQGYYEVEAKLTYEVL